MTTAVLATSDSAFLLEPREAPCLVCDHVDWTPRYRVLLECRQCGFLKAAAAIADETARALYDEGYFHGEEYADYLAESTVHTKNFRRRYQWMVEIAGRPSSVFEVGCAYGLWLQLLTAEGIRAAGIDVCAAAVDHARAVLEQDASCCDFMTAELTPGDFQIFVMWDTLEHLAQPEEMIARISELLPVGGWIFLTTGDVGSRNARRRGERWRMIHPPTHLHYFSRATVQQFLSRHGLETREIRSTPIFRNVRSTLANLAVLGEGASRGLAKIAGRLTPRLLQERLGGWIDLGDIMFVAAQKV